MKGGEVVRKIVNTNRSLQRTHTSTQPPPLPKLKEKKPNARKNAVMAGVGHLSVENLLRLEIVKEKRKDHRLQH